MSTARTILADGIAIIEPFLRSHNFKYERGAEGTGSGGEFARGRFVGRDRTIELHVRRALGLVRYHVGEYSLSHDEYMKAVTGSKGEYPGYSSDPLDGFRHLLDDLRRHGRTFLSGDEQEFGRLCP